MDHLNEGLEQSRVRLLCISQAALVSGSVALERVGLLDM